MSEPTAPGDAPRFPMRGIHRRVAEHVRSLPDLSGQRVLDIPAGDGRTSFEFRERGAEVIAGDLFPGFLKVPGLTGRVMDLTEPLPLEDGAVDGVVCQEGIEHVPDQLAVLREFNRVLRPEGTLWITTPSFSHLRARLARFLVESDYWKRLAPSEVDSIWFSSKDSDKLYFGHLFLLEASQLEALAALSGFRVERRLRTDLGNTSVCLALLLYPFLVLATLASYLVYRGEESDVDPARRRAVLWQRVRLNLSLKTLCCKHLFWVLRKERELPEVAEHLRGLTDPLWQRV